MAEKLPYSEVRKGLQARIDYAKAQKLPPEQVKPALDQFVTQSGWSPDEFRTANNSLSNSGVGSFMQGMTLGFGDELRGVGGAIKDVVMNGDSFGDAYNRNVAAERAGLEAYRDENPKMAFATEMAGGAVPSILAALATGGGSAPATIAQVAKQGAKLGAATGAVYGAGQGEGLTDRAMRAGIGGATGAATGFAAPYAVEGVKAAARVVPRMLPGGANRAADYAILRNMQRDNVTPQDVALRMRDAAALGKPATPADLGGKNMQGLADAVTNAPGEGLQIAKTALELRSRSGLSRISRDIAGAFGTQKRAMAAIKDSVARQKAQATPLYQQAYQQPVPPQVLAAFGTETKRGFGAKALSDAEKIIQATHGVDRIDQAPPVAVIDAWKQAMDDQWKSLKRAGEANKARAIRQQIDAVIPALDQAVPVYKSAREAFSGEANVQDAVEEGLKILDDKYGVDRLREWWSMASPSEKEGFRIGAASRLNDKLGSDKAKFPDLTKHLRDPATQEKIATIIENPAALKRWRDAFSLEERMAETLAKTNNSSTSYRQAARQDLDDMGIVPETFRAVFQGAPSFWASATNLTGAAARRVADTFNASRNAEIARRMMETDPLKAAQYLQKLNGKRAPTMPSIAWGGSAAPQASGGMNSLTIGPPGQRREVAY